MSEWDAREVRKLKKFEGERVCVSWVLVKKKKKKKEKEGLCVCACEREKRENFYMVPLKRYEANALAVGPFFTFFF